MSSLPRAKVLITNQIKFARWCTFSLQSPKSRLKMSLAVESRKGNKIMTQAEQFFYDNAGYSYDPATETSEQGRERCAREMARAEAYGREQGWEVEWAWDNNPDESFVDDWNPAEQAEWKSQEHECFVALLRDRSDNVLASCGGIFDPSKPYMQVMEAELMLEALGDIEREQRNAEECAKLTAS